MRGAGGHYKDEVREERVEKRRGRGCLSSCTGQEVVISRKFLVLRLHQVGDFYDLTAGDRKVDDPGDTWADGQTARL